MSRRNVLAAAGGVLLAAMGAAVLSWSRVAPPPVQGVAWIYSDGRWLLPGHTHGDTCVRFACPGCERELVALGRAVLAQAVRESQEAAQVAPPGSAAPAR